MDVNYAAQSAFGNPNTRIIAGIKPNAPRPAPITEAIAEMDDLIEAETRGIAFLVSSLTGVSFPQPGPKETGTPPNHTGSLPAHLAGLHAHREFLLAIREALQRL